MSEDERLKARGPGKRNLLNPVNPGLKLTIPGTKHDLQEKPNPNLEAPLFLRQVDGPIKLGNILKDPFSPWDPICRLNAVPNIIKGNPISLGTIQNSYGPQGFWSDFGIWTMEEGKTEQSFSCVQPYYFETNPYIADIKELSQKNSMLEAALKRGPVYIITGLNIASGLKYSAEHESTSKRLLKVPEGPEPMITRLLSYPESTIQTWNISFREPDDAILSYRLHTIKPIGWIWNRDYQIECYNTGKARFMDIQNDHDENNVSDYGMSKDNLNVFIDEKEYEEL